MFRPTNLVKAFVVLVAATAVARAQTVNRLAPREDWVVATSWLADHLEDRDLVVLHVTHDMEGSGEFARGHIPGAREVPYMAVTVTREGLSTELPSVDSLRSLFERLGVSNASRVVVHAAEAPMATRIIFTLYYLGVDRVALLDGGLPQWQAERRALSTTPVTPSAGRLTPNPRRALLMTADSVVARLAGPGTVFVDTRTDEEYLGTGGRRGMSSAGHLAGARQVEWEDLFVGPDHLRLKHRSELAGTFAAIAQPSETVVTYCWVGYRASATWWAAMLLGYDARFYDGSYQDWQRRGLPVRAGSSP